MLQSNPNDFTRIDRNMSRDLFSHYGEDEGAVKTMLVFLFEKYKQNVNLYGICTIDPYEYADMMKLSKASVRKKHKQPYQRQKLGEKNFQKRIDQGEELYLTNFENALYQLAYNDADVVYRYKNEHGEIVQENRPFKWLKMLKIIKDGTKSNSKKRYDVQFNDDVRNNLNGLFMYGKPSEYAELTGSTALQSLYFYLVELKIILASKNDPNEKIGRPAFKKLVDECHLESYEPADQKKKITHFFQLIKERCPSVRATLSWEGSGRWLYQPIIEFEFDNLFQETGKEQFNRFHKQFVEMMFEKHQQLKVKIPFEKWMTPQFGNVDGMEKRKVYAKAYNIAFGAKQAIGWDDERPRYWLEHGRHKYNKD